MVGSLGAASIGAVGLGSTLYGMVAIFGMGLLLGLDTLVSQTHGAGKQLDCRLWLVQGCVLALLLSLPIMLMTGVLASLLGRVGLDPSLSAPTSSLPPRRLAQHLAAATLHRLPALPPGNRPRPARHDGAGQRQSRQRRGQRRPHPRSLRLPSPRRHWRGLGHLLLPGSTWSRYWCSPFTGTSPGARCPLSPGGLTPPANAPADRPRPARRHPIPARIRRLHRRHGAGQQHGPRASGSPPRHAPDLQPHLHDAPGPLLRRGRQGRPCAGTKRTHPGRPRRLDRSACWVSSS